jgi:hypothetical protein
MALPTCTLSALNTVRKLLKQIAVTLALGNYSLAKIHIPHNTIQGGIARRASVRSSICKIMDGIVAIALDW